MRSCSSINKLLNEVLLIFVRPTTPIMFCIFLSDLILTHVSLKVPTSVSDLKQSG